MPAVTSAQSFRISIPIKYTCNLDGKRFLPSITRFALSSSIGSSQTVCSKGKPTTNQINKCRFSEILKRPNTKLATIIIVKTHYKLVNTVNTSFPIPSPIAKVTPGALNFNQASKKLMEKTAPIQIKIAANAIG